MKPMPAKPRTIIAHVEGSGTAAVAIVSALAVVAVSNAPLEQAPNEPAPPASTQGVPPTPPQIAEEGSPKTKLPVLPLKMEYADVVGVNVMLVGEAG